MGPRRSTASLTSQRGAALLIFALILISTLLGFFLSRLNSTTLGTQRDQITNDALAQAKEALIGFAATYRDTHPDAGNNNDKLFGYLPCPDTDNDGASDSCGATDVSLVGRLPWKTLGLPPLRDGSGECLWYAVSGRAKDNPKTDIFNWDTLGQLIIQDAGGVILAGASAHEYPLAIILAPRSPIAAQSRTSAGASECGGSNTTTDYLEGIGALGTGNTTLTLANADSIHNGTNNDLGLWISGRELFERIKRRQDFASDIKNLLDKLKTELDGIALASLPTGLTTVLGTPTCPVADGPGDQKDAYFRCNWKDNLKYFASPPAPPTPVTINGASCNAVLFFGGERNPGQSRATALEKSTDSNYLEGTSSTVFSVGGNYSISEIFNFKLPATDLSRCIQGLPAGGTQKSFAADFGSFAAVEGGGGAAVTPDASNQTVAITHTGISGNGCFWLSDLIPLAGKTLRAYYEFQFLQADAYALTPPTGSDRGYGFTFQIVKSDGLSAPNTCNSSVSAMGALGASDMWGTLSFIVETDVHKSGTDPAGNHTAIMTNGNLSHTADPLGTVNAACNGTATGCLHSPANKFEEGDATDNDPLPSKHNQRIEIHTGCNSTCTSCTPADHFAPAPYTKTYAKISVWSDCVDCTSVSTDFLGSELIAATENRDFSLAGNWTGTNWTLTAGAFDHVAGANPATLPNSALSSAPVATSTYNVKTTVATNTSGSLAISFGGTSSGSIPLSVGNTTLNIQLKAVSAGVLTVTPDTTWAGTIDNVSVTPWNIPTIQRCLNLNTELNSVYVGFTGGFLGATDTIQGVSFSNFFVRSD
jgi:type II secretory pathway pseudopilin PulG